MNGSLKLGQMLLQQGLLDPAALEAALAEQASSGGRLGGILVRLGYLSESNLVRMLSKQLRVPVVRIGAKRVNPEVLEVIPAELAEKYRCLPLFFKREGNRRQLFVAFEDPGDRMALDELAFQVGEKLVPVLIGPAQLDAALEVHYRHPEPAASADPSLTASSLAITEPTIAPPPRAFADAASPGATATQVTAPGSTATLVSEPRGDAGDATTPDAVTAPRPAGGTQTLPTPVAPGVTQPAAAHGVAALEESEDESDTQPQLPPVDPLLHPAPGSATPSLGDVLGHDTAPDLDSSLLRLLRSPRSAVLQPLEGLESARLLQALAELLVEKGVLSREELVERLQQLTAPGASG